VTQDVWLARHPYLQRAADFHAQVSAAAVGISVARPRTPNFDNYIDDYKVGIPLLRSSQTAIDFEPAEAILVSLVENLALQTLPENFAGGCRVLHTQLRGEMTQLRKAAADRKCPPLPSGTPAPAPSEQVVR